ncbi:hypothetical protein LZ554_000315 [Drepanopeziza brunnea f. sp. 'monogermtubi']|nr:hypothetical protein LZ554_000315 [Drepanopeziza brunnea f. sp. 'monogermtubi']
MRDQPDPWFQSASGGCTLVRKAGPLEVFTHLLHDLGVESNVLVACEYSHGTKTLSPARLFRILEQVITEIPELAVILTSQPSKNKKGNHQSWEARLPFIRFRDCVEFVEDLTEDKDIALARVIESSHNRWFDTTKNTKPWWRLLILNSRYVVFVFHHSIGDGMSGYAFHRSFLAALNADSPDTHEDAEAAGFEGEVFQVHEPNHPPVPLAIESIDLKLSYFRIICTFLKWQIIRMLYRPKHFLFSDAVVDKAYPTYTKRFPVEKRTRSRVETLRIDTDTMSKCLTSCRKHKTSFTALFQTIVSATLAADVYPNAKIGLSRMAVNIRPLMTSDPGLDVFTNASATYYRTHRLGKYRAAAHDNAALWKLATDYKNHMHDSIYKTGAVLQGFLTCTLLGDDDEDVGAFSGLGLYLHNSFLISNIGVFKPQDGMEDGGWVVTDVAFCAAAVRASMGDYGMVFMIASAKNGDCIVTATWEDGVLKDEMVRSVLGAVFTRLKSLNS